MTESTEDNTEPAGYNLTGHFLIAMPSLNDGFFNQAVTYICEHDESGSFGVIINQQTTISLKQVIQEMKIESGDNFDEDQAIFIGGPVDQGRGFILHRPTGNWSSSLSVTDGVIDAAPGTYYLIVDADTLPGQPPNFYPGVVEDDETNNWTASAAFTVTAVP